MEKENKEIVLENFRVNLRSEWRPEEEGGTHNFYETSATFSLEKCNFTINLPREIGAQLVAVCKKELAKHSQEALNKLRIAAGDDA